MPDNSFEHNMSRQMGDFSFPASEVVWQKLEVNLQKRKKRRWAIIWFFSGLVLVGTGFYFMARPAYPITEVSLVTNNLKGDISEHLPEIPKGNSRDKMLIPVSKSQRKDTKTEQMIIKKENDFNRQEIIEKSTENIVADSIIDKGGDSVSTPKSIDKPKETDSIAVEKIIPKKKTSKRSFSFGIRLEAGRSANTESSQPQSYTSNLISSPTAGGPTAFANPYTQQPSFGWGIGAWVRMPLRHRLNLQTGLQYHHYRTSTPVGSQVQNPLFINNGLRDMRSYYQPGNAANYQNNYHILSVPVEMSLQLNKGKKLPVSWVMGMEPGWMIGTNALIKDSSGYLYNNKSLHNSFQLGLQTGINFRMFQKTKHGLELGPVFRYMLTPAFENGTGYSGHLNFVGLRADWKIR